MFASCDKGSDSTNPPPTSGAEGGAPVEDSGAGPGEEGDQTEPGAPGVPWAEKTFEQRKVYMGVYVFPKMKEGFQGHDAEVFKDFKCQTCHGDDMEDKNFEMPNEAIYPLPKDDPIKAAKEYDEKMAAFMQDQVVPQMAELLDMQPMSADNPDGLGCFSCHPTK
jgi:hypothetical protein